MTLTMAARLVEAVLFAAEGPLTPQEIAEDIDRVEAADLARIGAGVLAPGRTAVSVLGPKPALKAAESFQRALFG